MTEAELPQIVAIGFEPAPLRASELQGRAAPVVSLPLLPEEISLEQLVDQLVDPVEAGAHLLAIYPQAFGPAAIRVLQGARCVLGANRLAAFASSLSPLAGGVAVSLCAALACYLPTPGVLVAALPALRRELAAVTLVRSVARISQPRPTALQRAASRLPAAAFAVALAPAAEIRRVRDGAVPSLANGADDIAALMATDSSNQRLVELASGAIAAGVPVDNLAPQPLGRAFFGCESLVEVVAYPTDVEALARRIDARLQVESCRWCGEVVAGERCPFCRSQIKEVAA